MSDSVQFKLMLPAGLKARVEDAAKHNRRSLSQEIVATLEEAFPEPVLVPVAILELAEYMSFVESAGSDEEREEFLRLTNESMLKNPETAAFEIRIGTDPDGEPALYVGKRRA